jgi:hypothetical protein
MGDQRISVHHRVLVLQRIEAMATELNAMASWLGQQGVEYESDLLDNSARDLLSVCWMLERPLRPRLPPTRWPQPADAAGMGREIPSPQPADQQQQAR